MFCERCGNPVGESEKFCSQCGAPLPAMEPAATAEIPETTAAAESVSVEAEATAAAESVPVEATAAAESVSVEAEATAAAESVPVEAAIPTPLSVPQVQEAPIAPAVPVDKPDVSGKKPKKKKAPFIIAACAVVAVVVICVVNGARLGNFFRRSFSSPEKYYQYVEENTVLSMAERSGAYYEALILDSLSMDGRSVDAEFALELEEGGQELIELLEMADVDLTWLTDLSMGVGYSLKDSLLEYDFSLGLNKSDILSLKTIADLEGGMLYFQIPELAADYLGVDLDEFTGGYGMLAFEAYEEMQEELAAVRKALPDTKEVEELLQRYLKLALSSVSDVEKSSKTLKVEGVQQKCTELEVTFDGKSLSKILKAVLKEMPKDKDLKKLFVSTMDSFMEIYGPYPEDGEDAWDAFIEKLEYLLDSLDELEDMDEVLVMKVYVDGRGKIVGRVLELVEGRETYATISILALEKGSRFGYEFSVQPGSGYDLGIALSGSGKKSGNKLTGDFKLKYGGISVLDMKVSELDMRQLEKGYLNGSITMTFSRQISGLLSTSMSYYGTAYAAMLADMQLTMDFQMAEDTGKVTLGIGYGDKDLAVLSMSVKTGNGSKLSVPDAGDTVVVEDAGDLEDWLTGIDWEAFIEKLDKANLPDEVLDALEEFVYLLDGGALEGLLNHYDEYYYGDDDYYGDYYGDNGYGDNYSPYESDDYENNYNYDDYFSDDNNGNGTYDDSLWGADNSLEQLLQSDDWQEELEGWNASVTDMGITITTEADGYTLVFSWHLPDDDFFGSLTSEQCAQMADIFLETLSGADFLSVFEVGYGISLDAVRVVFLRSDGTEIYRGEIY